VVVGFGVGFAVGFVGLVGLVGLVGFVGFVGFVGLAVGLVGFAVPVDGGRDDAVAPCTSGRWLVSSLNVQPDAALTIRSSATAAADRRSD